MKVFASGRNDNFQLTGLKCDVEQFGLPVVEIPQKLKSIPKNLKSVATGLGHSVFVCNNGKVFGVGDNSQNQLGAFDQTQYSTPFELTDADLKSDIVWAACGCDYTIFLNEDGGLIYNGRGKNHIVVHETRKMVYVTAGPEAAAAIDVIGDIHLFQTEINEKPVIVHLPSPVYDVARTNFFVIAVTVDGKCYGSGELNDKKSQYEFAEIESLKNVKVSRVYAFGKNACVISRDGLVFMRGFGSFGELGNGSFQDSYRTFVQVQIDEKVKTASLGQSFSVFVTKKGHVYGCGKNSMGSLFLGNITGNYCIPAKSKYIKEHATFVCSGNYHSLVITGNEIKHPGYSFFKVQKCKEKKQNLTSTVKNLFNFLDFSPE